MLNNDPAKLPFETTLVLRPDPPPRRLEQELPVPIISASRLRRIALLVF